MTVPFLLEGQTTEHFPDLEDFEIKKDEQGYFLVNKTKNGETQIHRDLIFHGGPGQTLEMRIFSENDITQHLKNAGFSNIKVWREPFKRYGILIPDPWSLPITTQKI